MGKIPGLIFVFQVLLGIVSARSSLNRITLPGCGRSKHFTHDEDRIVGGHDARHGQFPWMVSLQIKDDQGDLFHNCAGSILNENWILTAAHCVPKFEKPEMYNVFIGLQKLTETNDPHVQRLQLSHIFVHEGFNWISAPDDVALLKTAEPIDITGSDGFANGICLPADNQDPKASATAIGWGYMGRGSAEADALQQVVLPIFDRDACEKIYHNFTLSIGNTITENMICAGTKGKAVCHQDSGGPLFQTSSDGVSTIYGIASFGVGCGEDYTPMVFTKVSPYLSWIRNIISR